MSPRRTPYRHHARDACRRTEDGTHVRVPVLPVEEHACLECLAPATHPRELWAPDGVGAVVVWLCPTHTRALDDEPPP